MKKLVLLTLTVLAFGTSCNHDPSLDSPKAILTKTSPPNDFSKEIAFLDKLSSDGLKLALANLGKNISIAKDGAVSLDHYTFAEDIRNGLKERYATDRLIVEFPSLRPTRGKDSSVRVFSTARMSRDNMSAALSVRQFEAADRFTEQLSSVKDTKAAKALAATFQGDVISSDLSYKEKFELLSLASNVNSFADFMESGGMEEISNILFKNIGTDCNRTINWTTVAIAGAALGTATAIAITVPGALAALTNPASLSRISGALLPFSKKIVQAYIAGAVGKMLYQMMTKCEQEATLVKINRPKDAQEEPIEKGNRPKDAQEEPIEKGNREKDSQEGPSQDLQEELNKDIKVVKPDIEEIEY